MRWRRKPVRVQVLNGLKTDLPGYADVVELVPGQDVLITASVTYNVCDRGFDSDDGEHRLTQKTYEIPVYLRLVGGAL